MPKQEKIKKFEELSYQKKRKKLEHILSYAKHKGEIYSDMYSMIQQDQVTDKIMNMIYQLLRISININKKDIINENKQQKTELHKQTQKQTQKERDEAEEILKHLANL